MIDEGVIDGPAGRIAWRSAGVGEPLILVNGYAATAADWDPTFVASLADSARVICPDNRGLGGSDAGTGELTVAAMADDVIALADALGIESAVVAGWSMGGFVAQHVAATDPDRVDRLVLLGTDGGGPEAVVADAEVWHALTDHGGTPPEQAQRLLGLLFPAPLAEQIYAEFGDVVAAARGELDHDVLSAQEVAMIAWHRESAESRLAAIGCPVLVAAGDDDVVIPAVNSELLTAALPDARLERYPGGGHAFMAQEPERLAASIAAFAAG